MDAGEDVIQGNSETQIKMKDSNSRQGPMPVDLIESCQLGSNDTKDDCASEEMSSHCDVPAEEVVASSPYEDTMSKEATRCRPLKSVLITSSAGKNKGLKVTFHDTQIFLIDMDAQVSSATGPQLLPIHTFELSSVMTTELAAYDFVPSLPPGSYEGLVNRYTYEDAIVSFDEFNDHLVCHKAPVAAVPSVDALDSSTKNLLGQSAQEPSLNSDCPLLSALQQESLVNCQPDEDDQDDYLEEGQVEVESISPKPEGSADEVSVGLQTLTEANLKQHEILMEKTVEETGDDVKAEVPSHQTAAAAAAAAAAIVLPSGTIELSPPLKELTVDVEVFPKDEWQVELSPLNSLPPDSDTESSTSQDTIIMMTSDESRRNEQHIQLSTDTYHKAIKQESDSSSWGSDDTVTTPGGAEKDARNEDELDSSCELQKTTSDQIRQILERNAFRRNHLRCNNTSKKRGPSIDGLAGVPAAIEKQRQWRSHESLLDTIKKLTLDDKDGSLTIDHTSSAVELDESARTSTLLLSSTELGCFQNPSISRQVELNRTASCDRLEADVAVPKDVRQWKIRANMWGSLSGSGGVRSSNFRKWPPATMLVDLGGSLPCIRPSNRTAVTTVDDTVDQANDELLQFVTEGSDRIARIRKRYSYCPETDAECGEVDVNGFARRPSVRGIKPRFGSTTEILKQMQSRLQPPPLAFPSANHMTWPYPLAHNNRSQQATALHHQPTTLPVLQEELFGTPRPVSSSTHSLPTYSNNNDYQPVYRPRRGRDLYSSYGNYVKVNGNSGTTAHASLPPPYQPPPPPYQANRNLLFQAKGERGVPEGAASSSTQGHFDVIHSQQQQQQQQQQQRTLSEPSDDNKDWLHDSEMGYGSWNALPTDDGSDYLQSNCRSSNVEDEEIAFLLKKRAGSRTWSNSTGVRGRLNSARTKRRSTVRATVQ